MKLFGKILLLVILIISCSDTPVFSQTFILPDTIAVGDTVGISFAVEKPVCISGFGADLVYPVGKFEFIEAQTYNIFFHESIALANGEQGRLIFGFNEQDSNVVCLKPLQKIFTIRIYIKNSGTGSVIAHLENKHVLLNGEQVRSEWQNLEFNIEQLFKNVFILE